jgi:hypothetical protein
MASNSNRLPRIGDRVDMKPEGVWRRGRLWSAVRIGAPAGAVFGLLQFARSGSAGRAVVDGVLFAALFGAAMALFIWRSWPEAEDLSSMDRVAVVRVVHQGEHLKDPRLAAAVLDYVAVVRRTWDLDRRYGRLLWAFAGLSLIAALAATFGGSARSAAVWWVTVAFWVCILVWLPRKRARLLSRASQADEAARRLLRTPPTT